MRKLVLLLTVLAIAMPSIADAKSKRKRHRHHKPPAAAQVDPNANTGKLVGDGLNHIFVPLQSLSR